MRRIASLFVIMAALLVVSVPAVKAQSYTAVAHNGFCYTSSVEQCSFPLAGGGNFSFDSTGAARLYISFGHVEQAPTGSLSYTIKSAEFGACPDYPGNGTCEFVVIDVSGEWRNADGTTATVSGEYTVESVHAGRNNSNRPYSGGLTITVQ